MNYVRNLIALSVLFATSANAGSMRHNIPNQISSPNSNIYWAIAQQSRFDPVGFIQTTLPGGKAGGCAGSFIDANTVITAAHCVYDGLQLLTADKIQFSLGPKIGTFTSTFSVFDLKVHSGFNPAFNPNSVGYMPDDIAVLQVGNPKISSHPIAKLYGGIQPLGAFGVLAGYGVQGTGADGLDLTKFGVKLAGLNTIDSFLNNGKVFKTDFDSLPAGSNTSEYIGLDGDSGAPFIINDPIYTNENAIVGILSTVAGTGKYGTTNTLTYVPPYKNWIETNAFGNVDFTKATGFSPDNPHLPSSYVTPSIRDFFWIPVLPFVPAFFDPFYSEAYEFSVLDGPLFAGFQVPFIDDDGKYAIYSWDTALNKYVFLSDLSAGVWFDFDPSGITRFAVGGISDIGKDPVFGLQFATGGFASFRQAAVSLAQSPGGSVPEPGTWILLLSGFVLAGVGLRRPKSIRYQLAK